MELKGLGIFAWRLTVIMAAGHKETTNKILEEINNNNLVKFLVSKYDKTFNRVMEQYNVESINKFFKENYSGSLQNYGISNEKDGLLLLLGIYTCFAQVKTIDW